MIGKTLSAIFQRNITQFFHKNIIFLVFILFNNVLQHCLLFAAILYWDAVVAFSGEALRAITGCPSGSLENYLYLCYLYDMPQFSSGRATGPALGKCTYTTMFSIAFPATKSSMFAIVIRAICVSASSVKNPW